MSPACALQERDVELVSVREQKELGARVELNMSDLPSWNKST
jgi:hypothetical protein